MNTLQLRTHIRPNTAAGKTADKLEMNVWRNTVIWVTYLLTYRLTPCIVLLEKLASSQLVKKFPAFYGTWRIITSFTSARHLSLSWARKIQSTLLSYFLKKHCNIIFPSMPGSFKWPPSLSFPHQNSVCTSPIPHTCYMLRPFHTSWSDNSNNIGRRVHAGH